jgi:hypothetical protein
MIQAMMPMTDSLSQQPVGVRGGQSAGSIAKGEKLSRWFSPSFGVASRRHWFVYEGKIIRTLLRIRKYRTDAVCLSPEQHIS